MDTTKWKSIAVSTELYEILKKRAKKNDRSVGGELAHIVKTKLAEEKAA